MSDLLSLSRCTLAELDEVAELFDEYRSFYGQSSDRDGCRRFLHDRIARQESVILLARLETRAAGFVQLYHSFSSIAMKEIWILNDLFVLESARQRGVGTELLNAAEQFARESNAIRLTLATGIENVSAQSLYEKLGWLRDNAYFHYLKPIEQSPPENSDDV
jgi:GNAT superfamily N-acetyltransferase